MIPKNILSYNWKYIGRNRLLHFMFLKFDYKLATDSVIKGNMN